MVYGVYTGGGSRIFNCTQERWVTWGIGYVAHGEIRELEIKAGNIIKSYQCSLQYPYVTHFGSYSFKNIALIENGTDSTEYLFGSVNIKIYIDEKLDENLRNSWV